MASNDDFDLDAALKNKQAEEAALQTQAAVPQQQATTPDTASTTPQYDPSYTPVVQDGQTIGWENQTGGASKARPILAGQANVTANAPTQAPSAQASVQPSQEVPPEQFDLSAALQQKQAEDNQLQQVPANPVTDAATQSTTTPEAGIPPKDDEVSNPDAKGFLARADIGLSSSFEDKAAKFQKYFGPDASLTQQFEATDPKKPDQKEPVMYYTLHPGDAPTRFTLSTSDALKEYGHTLLNQLKAWNYEDDSLNTSAADQAKKDADQAKLEQTIEDGYKNVLIHMYADNSGNLPAAVGMAAATGGAGTLGIILKTLVGAGGSVLGEGANLAQDKARGYTVPDASGQLVHAGEEGAAGMFAGEIFSRLAAKVMRVAGGEGFMSLSDGAKQLIQDAKTLQLPMPMPQQVLNTWIGLKKLMNQVKGMDSGIGAQETQQERAAYALLRKMSPIKTDAHGDFIPGSTQYEDLKPQLQDSWFNYLDKSNKAYPEPEGTSTFDPATQLEHSPFEVAGRNVDIGLDEYSNKSAAKVDQLYSAARVEAEPSYNMDVVNSAIDDAEKGLSREGLPPDNPPQEIVRDGVPTPPEAPDMVRVTAPPEPALQSIFNTIKSINPDAMDTAAINALRRRLWGYFQTDATGRFPTPEAQQQADMARSVYNAFNQMMDNASTSPLWKQASFEARQRFTNLEVAKVIQVMKAGDGDTAAPLEALAQTLANSASRQGQNIKHLKKLLPPDKFQSLSDAIEMNWRSDPATMMSKVDKWDRDYQTRRMFFPDSYWRDQIQPLAAIYDGMKKTNIPAILDAQSDAVGGAYQIINKLFHAGSSSDVIDTATVDRIFDMVGGRNSDAGQSIRAGIIDKILDSASKAVEDYSILKGDKLAGLISSAENKRLSQFLTDQDMKNLKAVSYYLRWIQQGGVDMGSSLEAASEFARLRHLEPEAIGAFVKSHLISRFVTSRFGERMFYGTGGDVPKISPSFMTNAVAFINDLTRNRYKESNTPSVSSQTYNAIKGKL